MSSSSNLTPLPATQSRIRRGRPRLSAASPFEEVPLPFDTPTVSLREDLLEQARRENPSFGNSEAKPYATPLPSDMNPFSPPGRFSATSPLEAESRLPTSAALSSALSAEPLGLGPGTGRPEFSVVLVGSPAQKSMVFAADDKSPQKLAVAQSGGNFGSYNELMENASLEKELLQAGYVPREKIFIKRDGGDNPASGGQPSFIKASNKLGQTVYIMVDGKGYVVGRQGDLTLIQAKTASVLPFSLKMGVMECAGLEVCGVAFECDDEICTLIREEGETDIPRETTFTLAQKKGPSAIVDQDHVAYPIVRLSEIRADPAGALANTMTAAARIRKAAAQNCVGELTALKCAIEELTLAYNRFVQTRDDFDEKICVSLTELEGINREKFSGEPTTEKGRENLRKVRYNLHKRYEFSDALLRTCRKASARVGQIRRHTNELNLLSEYCLKEFSGVEFVLEETS